MIGYRNAIVEDTEAIKQLLEVANLTTSGLSNHIQHFLVATNNIEIIDVAGAELYFPVALIRSVAVNPAFKNQGIGYTLVNMLTQQLHQQHFNTYYLLTETAAPFFTKMGFETILREHAPESIQQTEEYSSICPTTAVIMTKKYIH